MLELNLGEPFLTFFTHLGFRVEFSFVCFYLGGGEGVGLFAWTHSNIQLFEDVPLAAQERG